MAFTVKKLAKISGVSERTLRYYDSIGLLKPARYGDNGYRYYEREQIEELQQILFYRELGFPLEEIQRLLKAPDHDRAAALRSHREALGNSIRRNQDLIRTIDRTLSQWEGGSAMKPEEYFKGFDPQKQKVFEQELVDRYGEDARTRIEESHRRMSRWTAEGYETVKKEMTEIHEGMVVALQESILPDSPEVQSLVERHYKVICRFYDPTPAVYRGLGDLYVDHPDFRKTYDPMHPKLAEYLREAMHAYADRRWGGSPSEPRS